MASGETAKLAPLLPAWVPGRQAVATAGQSLENAAGAPTAIRPRCRVRHCGCQGRELGPRWAMRRCARLPAPPPTSAARSRLDVVPGGALAYLGARNLGDTADARAAPNNGHAAPTASDALQALPSTAAQALIGRYGLGKTAAGLPQGLRQLAQVGLEGAAGTASDAAGQLGASTGTQAGTQFGPHGS